MDYLGEIANNFFKIQNVTLTFSREIKIISG